MFQIESCAKQHFYINGLFKKWASTESAQILIKQHSNFRWHCVKAWKQCLA